MKAITLKDENGKVYTLEFTKAIIMHMERQGFNTDEFDAKPVLMATMLVQGAFMKNHPTMKADKIEKVYQPLKNKRAFLEKLLEMYNEQADELVDEGNAEWEANF